MPEIDEVVSIKIKPNLEKRDNWIKSATNMESTVQRLAIPRVPLMLHVDATTFEKHYEPRVVSLGPYHFGKAKLQTVQDFKRTIMNKFVVNESENLEDLYNKVWTLCRDSMNEWYEKDSLPSDIDEFAQMMILDGCFILYFIECISNGSSMEKQPNMDQLEMKRHDIVLVQQDMFLHENQLPFCVLGVLMNKRRKFHIDNIDNFVRSFLGHSLQTRREIGCWRNNLNRINLCFDTLKEMIMKNPKPTHSKHTVLQSEETAHQLKLMAPRVKQKAPMPDQLKAPPSEPKAPLSKQKAQSSDHSITLQDPVHLLQHLHSKFVGKKIHNVKKLTGTTNNRYTFRNVDELWGAGIYVRPSQSYDLSAIRYVRDSIYTYLELPRITVDDSTRTKFMNLIAYEMCSEMNKESWVTSYICFLDSLIDHKEDVKILRSEEILHNCLGSDEEVSKLFNDIGYDLVPNEMVYEEVMQQIQKHYDQKWWREIVEFCHEHFRSTWSSLAFVGAIVALFLSGVQAYFSVWSLPSDCEGLCKYIKKTHHL